MCWRWKCYLKLGYPPVSHRPEHHATLAVRELVKCALDSLKHTHLILESQYAILKTQYLDYEEEY